LENDKIKYRAGSHSYLQAHQAEREGGMMHRLKDSSFHKLNPMMTTMLRYMRVGKNTSTKLGYCNARPII